MPHAHIVVILDWEKQQLLYNKAGGQEEFTPEMYCENYISAEFPAEPNSSDTSNEANMNREYRQFIANSLYHTCRTGRCKEKRGDKCNKRFPVIYSF
jgi:hypothetical protein